MSREGTRILRELEMPLELALEGAKYGPPSKNNSRLMRVPSRLKKLPYQLRFHNANLGAEVQANLEINLPV